MSLTKETKGSIITQHRMHASDTGSPEVQIAMITSRINSLTEHFKIHQHDKESRRGLMRLVSQRRKLLDYLQSTDSNRYRDVVKRLDLRR